jgi:hypothetical protein
VTELEPTTGTSGNRPSQVSGEPEPAAGKGRPSWSEIFTAVAEYVDRRIGWDRLPLVLGLADLVGLRMTLRQRNLHDTSQLPAVNLPPIEPPSPSHEVNRTADGSYNDLIDPRMGMAGARFGRNIPLDAIVSATPSGSAHTQSPRDQPGPAHPHRVHPGELGELAAGGVAAIHDPRLVQSRTGAQGRPVDGPACR